MPDTATHIELNVQGMSCTNCALGVEKYLSQEGAKGISVDFASGEVNFDLPPEGKHLPQLIKGIEQLGFSVQKEQDAARGSQLSKVEWYFLICLVFTLPLLLAMFIPWDWLHNPWVQLGISLPVYVLGSWHFGQSAIRSLRTGVPNMDVLIFIGATAAFGYSLYGTLNQLGPDFLFYETAAAVITLVLLGNVIEHRAVKRTTSAVQALVGLQPETAILVGPQGQQHEVPINQVQQGDLLFVPEGAKIPVDGRLREGSIQVDESMLTGESDLISKSLQDAVFGGTVVVEGHAVLEATRIGKETKLAQIIQLVKQAQRDKPQIQQLADRIAAVFVPVVLCIAILTFVVSYWGVGLTAIQTMIHSIAVLVIACPCAMGLATPTAVVVGIGRASRQGILIKGARTLEHFKGVKRVVFDKTGTLTTGNFQVERIDTEHQAALADIQAIILRLEQHSHHPIARSFQVAFAEIEPAEMMEVKEMKGLGMSGKDMLGNLYQLGSFRLVEGMEGIPAYDVYLLKNGAFWAGIALQDEIRAGAIESIQYLQAQGIEPVMLSGDRHEKCDTVAQQLGIQTVLSEQLPEDKVAFISQSAASMPTVMVGDGINDAPALARAHIGISLGGGTDIAMQAAQVIFLRNDLSLLPTLFQISHHTLRTIRQNLFWAFFYNVLAIPLAAVGFLRPMIAAASMALSDVFVIGNSLRLRVKSIDR